MVLFLSGMPIRLLTRLLKMMELLGLKRFYLHLPIASMPHKDALKAIEIYGKEVVPKVKNILRIKAN